MRRYILIVLAALLSLFAKAQITGLEYFTDADPGYGHATPLAATVGNNIEKNFTLALGTLSEGFHVVGFRAKNAAGIWSHTYMHGFFIISNAVALVSGAEYYLDRDPGVGKGTPVPSAFASDSSLNQVIPLTALAKGFHTLGLRVKNSGNRWSATHQHIFLVSEGSQTVPITRLEYYFTGSGASNSVYSYSLLAPSTTVDLNFTANLSGLVANREYDMHIIAVDSLGTKSGEAIKKIKVCDGDVASAKFDFVQTGTRVSFMQASTAAFNYQWLYGDGKTDTVPNSLHIYPSVGIYQVKLVASNACNSDTATKTVSVVGLKDITSNHGGIGGKVTVTVRGAGFKPGMQLFLSKNGQPAISGDTLLFQNEGSLLTTFDLKGKTAGLYDVVAHFPGGKSDTLHNGFSIEPASGTKLAVDIRGPGVLRIGFNQIYTITMSNNGNTDAVFVPLGIGGLPLGTDIEILNPLFNVDSLPPFNNQPYKLDTVRRTIDDTARNMSFRLLYINRIAANGAKTLNVIFHVPGNTPLHSVPKIVVVLGEPILLTNTATQRRMDAEPGAGECFGNLLTKAGTTLFSNAANIGDVQSCAIGAIGTFNSVLDIFNDAFANKKDLDGVARSTLDFIDFQKQFTGAFVSCVKAAGVTISAPEYFSGVLAKTAADLVWDALINYKDVINCSKAFYNVAKDAFSALIGNAWDPNGKYGPGDSSPQHYSTAGPFAYTIGFENSPAANLNAQTVTVIDTLDESRFDLSTFGFTSVVVGDSAYTLPSPATSFVHEFDFVPSYGVKARVTAKFDTATGIAQWKLISVDPATNQTTTNALAGFLPPDVASPKGQGYVSFAVHPKPGIQDGDLVKNKATIRFDNNPVIVTNEWPVTFDLVKPGSAIVGFPSEVYDTSFAVQWAGTDNASGIDGYDIFYKVNSGAYRLWLPDAAVTQSQFTGKRDSTYSFYSIAKDKAGNVENGKSSAERVVTIRNFDSATVACGGNTIYLAATSAGAGFAYQWQVDQGTGFTNLANNNFYSGVTTTELIVGSAPTSFARYRYRCKISNGTVTYYSSLHQLKFISFWLGGAGNAWETAANWSCGVVPDANTDVFIKSNSPHWPVVNVASMCKSLTLESGAHVLVKTGVTLTILEN